MGINVAKYPSAYTEHVSSNTRSKSTFNNCVNHKTTQYWLETLSFDPRVWDMIPIELKNTESFGPRVWDMIPIELKNTESFGPRVWDMIPIELKNTESFGPRVWDMIPIELKNTGS